MRFTGYPLLLVAALDDSAKSSRRDDFHRHRYRDVVTEPDASVATSRAARFPVGASITIERLTTDLHPTLTRLRANEPVSWLPALGGWLVTDHRTAIEILRDPDRFTVDDDRFTTGRVVGPSMLSTDGAQHRAHRGPFEPMFRRAPVGDFADTIGTTATALVDGFKPNHEAELRTAFAAPLATSVIASFLGFHDHCATTADTARVDDRLLSAYRTIVDTVVGLGTGTADSDDAADAMIHIEDLVERAVRSGGPLARLTDDHGGISREQLRSNVAVILFGAIETCEGMTANAIGHILADGAVIGRLRAGTVDVHRVVNESLRLEPAAAVVDRYATTDIDLGPNGAASIAAGDLVEVSLAGANRDPTVFPDPDRFDPDRAGVGQHLAFARGPHVCLGLHLAKLQTAVALETLVRELPTIEFDEERSVAPRGHIFRKPERVSATW